MLPIVKIVSTRKTPTITTWWIDWSGTRLGPFALERDACRRAVDMVDMAWQTERKKRGREAPMVIAWQDMATILAWRTEPTLSLVVGACRAARDAVILTVASAPWSEQLALDALSHGAQWLAPLIGADPDTSAEEGPWRYVYGASSQWALCCNLDTMFFTMRGKP